jgi:hypothetical protein
MHFYIKFKEQKKLCLSKYILLICLHFPAKCPLQTLLNKGKQNKNLITENWKDEQYGFLVFVCLFDRV